MSTGTRQIAVYPGSFDPITNGHVDIVHRSLAIFDRVVVAVAANLRKTSLFSIDERIEQARAVFGDGRVEVDSFSGLLVDYARRRGAGVVVRGLRALADFEYEFQLAHMNRRLAPTVETVVLMTGDKDFFLSSSLVKEVASLGGDLSGLVPEVVRQALHVRFGRA